MRGIWACLIFDIPKNSKWYIFHIPLSYINYYPWSSIIIPYHQLITPLFLYHYLYHVTMFHYYPYEPWQNQQRWFIPNRARRASTRTNPIYASSSPNCWEWQQCHAYQHAWGIHWLRRVPESCRVRKIHQDIELQHANHFVHVMWFSDFGHLGSFGHTWNQDFAWFIALLISYIYIFYLRQRLQIPGWCWPWAPGATPRRWCRRTRSTSVAPARSSASRTPWGGRWDKMGVEPWRYTGWFILVNDGSNIKLHGSMDIYIYIPYGIY